MLDLALEAHHLLTDDSAADFQRVVGRWVDVCARLARDRSREPVVQVVVEVREQAGERVEGLWEHALHAERLLEHLAVPFHRLRHVDAQLQELALAGGRSCSNLWGGRRPAITVLASEEREEHMDTISADQVLGEEIRGILLTADFEEFDLLAAHLLLDPQALGVDMPQLSQALASADPDGRRAVCPDTHGEFKAYVS